jgi:hypothetical protein
MARISIQDLSDSIELDQEAMRAILGGARTPRERLQLLREQDAKPRSSLRLVDQARYKRLADR